MGSLEFGGKFKLFYTQERKRIKRIKRKRETQDPKNFFRRENQLVFILAKKIDSCDTR